LVLGGATHPLSATLPRGRVRLQVKPLPPLELLAPPRETGRALLNRATHASLEFARSRQYDAFLGNPDPGGPSRTVYLYVSGRPASAEAGQSPRAAGHGWVRSLLIAVAALATAAAAAVAWARS
jgi:hypothetical protein